MSGWLQARPSHPVRAAVQTKWGHSLIGNYGHSLIGNDGHLSWLAPLNSPPGGHLHPARGWQGNKGYLLLNEAKLCLLLDVDGMN